MQLLTAVNTILPKLGEHPVTKLDAKHPTLAIILPEVDLQLRTLLIKGWWFNQSEVTLYPDSEKKVAIGTDVMDFVPQDATVALRGKSLYDTSTNDYKFSASVKGLATYYVPFDDLPEAAALSVLYTSLVQIYATDIGLEQVLQLWETKRQEANQLLLAAHLRNKKYSTQGTRRMQRIRASLRG